ncbi:hypothetical protein [Paraburkholderia kirstenboschensis]|uniref:Lipoprotein n=1 Tax=Paraburkholderia kirstenboschensis TaxID=1245436 RepID=A0ABZ0EDE0_9BURK|nr:hypothetical protein [Paraburkholderia kirstenboschensis]WOD14484.1 hypothetical protein RW095_03185 [Paraburkholderia kirstenboschensis]
MLLPKTIAALAITATVSGCAFNVQVASQSGAAEVMTNKVRQEKAYVVFGDSLVTAGRDVKSGFACGAHKYPMYIGPALQSSISRTVEAAYPNAINTGSQVPSSADGIVMKFDLADFDPRIRFLPGFWVPTADANVDLAIKARLTDAKGKELLTTTFRGQGHASEDGSCPIGADALGQAAQKAIANAMESFVDKVFNTGALDAALATTVAKDAARVP